MQSKRNFVNLIVLSEELVQSISIIDDIEQFNNFFQTDVSICLFVMLKNNVFLPMFNNSTIYIPLFITPNDLSNILLNGIANGICQDVFQVVNLFSSEMD